MQLILFSPENPYHLVTPTTVVFQVLGDELATKFLAAAINTLGAAVEAAEPRVAGSVGFVGGERGGDGLRGNGRLAVA